MAFAHSKVTAQGRISIPAEVRRKLGIGPGSILKWEEDGERIVVRRVARFTSEEIHRALFSRKAPSRRSLGALKKGVPQSVRERWNKGV